MSKNKLVEGPVRAHEELGDANAYQKNRKNSKLRICRRLKPQSAASNKLILKRLPNEELCGRCSGVVEHVGHARPKVPCS